MEISYIGHSSFKIRTKQATIITDPYTIDGENQPFPKKQIADIVTVSHDHEDHNNSSVIGESPYIVNGPGEYEIKGIGIIGTSVYHDENQGTKRGKNTIYRFDVNGISLVHLGDLGHVLSSEQADHLDGVDVLFIPIGGIFTIGPKEATEVIKEISPSVVIPMHYRITKNINPMFNELKGISDFLEILGVSGNTPTAKYTLHKDSIPEEMEIVIFE